MSMEILNPIIREDFTDGDRVYAFFDGRLIKGTVMYDPDEYIDHVTMLTDDGLIMPVHLSKFNKEKDSSGYCGRIPKVEEFAAGTNLSFVNAKGIRLQVEIHKVIPGEMVRFRYPIRPDEYFDRKRSDKADLEDFFLDWEIEG